MSFKLDPRCKLYLLLIGNLLLFFHVDLATEMCLMCFFLLPFGFSKKWKTGLRLTLMYVVLLAIDFPFVSVNTHDNSGVSVPRVPASAFALIGSANIEIIKIKQTNGVVKKLFKFCFILRSPQSSCFFV